METMSYKSLKCSANLPVKIATYIIIYTTSILKEKL